MTASFYLSTFCASIRSPFSLQPPRLPTKKLKLSKFWSPGPTKEEYREH